MNNKDTDILAWAHAKPRRFTDGLFVPAVVALVIAGVSVSAATSHRPDQPMTWLAFGGFSMMLIALVVRFVWNVSRMSWALIAETSRRDRVRALEAKSHPSISEVVTLPPQITTTEKSERTEDGQR